MLMMMWLTTFVEMTNFCAMREKGMMDFRTDNHEIRTSVCSDIRFDMEGHFSEPCPTTKRCVLCKNTRKWCLKCKKGLHDRCFNEFHGVMLSD